MINDKYTEIFNDKQNILFVFAHPDDAEIYAGGTIARLVQDNKKVSVVKMTLGNKGSRQENISEMALGSTRLNEDLNAMNTLGIEDEDNIYLKLPDGEVENTLSTIEKLVYVIRKFQPDIVITHNPEDLIIRWDDDTNWINHRDHRNTGKSVVDACYPYSRDILFFPKQFQDPSVKSHCVTEYLFVDYYNHPDTIAIDVTSTIDLKVTAISSHSSQYSLEDAISSTDFFTKIDDTGRRYERFRHVIAD